MLMSFLRRPQRVWFRRAIFQIHLWVGIAFCLYVLVIGVSGSILVFRDELQSWSRPDLMRSAHIARPHVRPPGWQMDTVAQTVRRAYSNQTLTYLYAPGVRGENYMAYLRDRQNRYNYAFVSADDGSVLGYVRSGSGWIETIADLHFRLLAGGTGFIINGIGSACLLLLCISGAVIWWPGTKTWRRALTVDFKRRWRRINFDLHSAVGFWTLLILSVWAISGVYFVWPKQFVAAVSVISPARAAEPPPIELKQPSREAFPLATYANRALAEEPGAWLAGVGFSDGKQPLSIVLARTQEPDFMRATWVYFDPKNGQTLGRWRRGENQTLGDWFTWIIIPLHFGTSWGLGVKALWALLGLGLPLLSMTGVVLYWNRVLSRKWRELRGNTSIRSETKQLSESPEETWTA